MRRPLRHLQQKHHDAIRLNLEGMSHTEVGDALGVKRYTVGWWFKSAVVIEERERQRTQASKGAMLALQAATRKAVTYLTTAIDPAHTDYEKVKATGVRSAFGILDRVGLTPFAPRELEQAKDENEGLASMNEIREILKSLPKDVLEELLAEDEAIDEAPE